MMKKIIITVMGAATAQVSYACEVCARQQPKILRGITHGVGPEGMWDYVIVGTTAVVGVIALFYSMKWILRPGEQEPGHVKYSILNEECP